MKKFQNLILLLAFIMTACMPGKPPKQAPQPAPETDPVSTSIPAPQIVPTVQADCAEPICLTASISLLDLQNRSVDENVLKLF
ncbi:MAG TPA: hypothetical protein PLF18_06990, partial [Anaerolineales bacterium]|nr:hypothetical protein [Anaerolineales bacterium]